MLRLHPCGTGANARERQEHLGGQRVPLLGGARAKEGTEFLFVLGPELAIVYQPVWLQITLRRPCLECAGRFEKATHEARCSQVQQDHGAIAALIGPGPGVCRRPPAEAPFTSRALAPNARNIASKSGTSRR